MHPAVYSYQKLQQEAHIKLFLTAVMRQLQADGISDWGSVRTWRANAGSAQLRRSSRQFAAEAAASVVAPPMAHNPEGGKRLVPPSKEETSSGSASSHMRWRHSLRPTGRVHALKPGSMAPICRRHDNAKSNLFKEEVVIVRSVAEVKVSGRELCNQCLARLPPDLQLEVR